MADLDGFTGGSQRQLAAILLMQAGMYTLDAYSTLNSSPWTAENFGGDEVKMKSLREYIMHAAVYSTAYCTGAAVLAASPWPIIGAVLNNAYLVWLYRRAAARGAAQGSTDWANSTGGSPSPVRTSRGSSGETWG